MKRRAFAYPYIVWMILFIAVPMLFIFYYAVTISGKLDLSVFWDTLKNPVNWKLLLDSIVMSLKTTGICLLLGYPIAYILSNMKKSVAGFISVLFFVPMWMNFVLRTYAWQAILNYVLPSIFGSKGTFTGTEWAVLWCWCTTTCRLWCCPFTTRFPSSTSPCWKHPATLAQTGSRPSAGSSSRSRSRASFRASR